MNQLSGLEFVKDNSIFANGKIVMLPARDQEFAIGELLRRSWNTKGLVSCTTGCFDTKFVLGRNMVERPVYNRKIAVLDISSTVTDHDIISSVGRGKLGVNFVDLYHLILQENENNNSVFPSFGTNHFFVYDSSWILCLCLLTRDYDGGDWRLDYREIGRRPRTINQGTLILKFN